jgi:hypothetical protein
MKKLTQTALAARLGLTQQQVSRLAAAGMPTDEVGKAKRWRRANVDQGRAKDGAHKEGMDAARLRKLEAEAALLEGRAKIGVAGALISTDSLTKALLSHCVESRALFDQLHPEIVAAVAQALDLKLGDAGYDKMHKAVFHTTRTGWVVMCWGTLARALIREQPSLYRWFSEFATKEDGKPRPTEMPPEILS